MVLCLKKCENVCECVCLKLQQLNSADIKKHCSVTQKPEGEKESAENKEEVLQQGNSRTGAWPLVN